jgi:type III secretion system low calcium response chaperone LcrH/SycD
MQPEEKPELQAREIDVQEKKRWKASQEIEDECLEILGKVLPTTLRASPARLEQFYDHGYMLYKFGRYNEAHPYFHMLTLADPENGKYLMASAACYHMLKDYASAIQLYSMTMFFEPDNPLPLYHMADCYIKIFQAFNALISLEMAIEKCVNPKFHSLKDRMKMMVNRLGNELKEKVKESSESFIGTSGKKMMIVNGLPIQE